MQVVSVIVIPASIRLKECVQTYFLILVLEEPSVKFLAQGKNCVIPNASLIITQCDD